MYSNIIPFETVIEGIKDDTGLTNLRNHYPRIRRLIYRCEQDIGFGSTVLLKKKTYCVSDGSIIINGNTRKIKLPEDIIEIEKIGSCESGLCPGDYIIQGNWMFLCKKNIETFTLIYYSLLCDGNGNPVVSRNHFQAIIAGCSFMLYSPKVWNGEGSRAVKKDLQLEYEERISEARGDDVMPSTPEEWSKMAALFRMSTRDIIMFSEEKRCFDCLPDASELTKTTLENMYYWQFDNLVEDISIAPTINQAFLDTKSHSSIENFLNGHIIDYTEIGRIAFAIQNIKEDAYRVFDVFDSDITNIVFDSYYNTELKTQIYISKEYYSHGNIYFKLIPSTNA